MITTCIIHCTKRDRGEAQVAQLKHLLPAEVVYLCHSGVKPLPHPASWKVLVEGRGIGVPEARNICLKAASHDYVLWLDDDIIPKDISYEQAFLDGFSSQGRVGVVGYETLIIQLDFENQWFVDPLVTPSFDYIDSPFAVNKKMIAEIGGFDEQLGRIAGSNTDLCIRAKKAGWELVAIENPGVRHLRGKRGMKYTGVIDVTAETQKSHKRLRAKHGPRWKEPQSFIIDARLQFPDIKGRQGGPEEVRGRAWHGNN